MTTMTKQEYDPHLLYHAINITVELEYKVPMQKIYNILSLVEESNKHDINQVSPTEVLSLLKTLGDKLEDSVLTDDPPSGSSLQEKIKELLRLLGCTLSDKELNQILKGEVSLDQALSKPAKSAWLTIFDLSEDGKYRPNKEIIDNMLICSQAIALESIEMKLQRSIEDKRIMQKTRQYVMYHERETRKREKDRYDPIVLDKKRAKLKIYIAHMHGYDRDRDRDGGLGIDMTTGEIIDHGDIYIADKIHGSIIRDVDRDGIDMRDIH